MTLTRPVNNQTENHGDHRWRVPSDEEARRAIIAWDNAAYRVWLDGSEEFAHTGLLGLVGVAYGAMGYAMQTSNYELMRTMIEYHDVAAQGARFALDRQNAKAA